MHQVHDIDTHASIVQASSARLIQCLFRNYPDIELDPSGQASLLYYLGTLINPSAEIDPEEIQKAKGNPSISGTIAMAEYIAALPEENLSAEDKQRVFKQMQFIAHSYPGGAWSPAQEQWSLNRFYNPKTQEDALLMTPPAQALNLVCRALLDGSHYRATNEDEAARDKAHRVANFYNQLLELQRQVERGQLEKCSAGLQHDLLYLLDRTYLGDDEEPIHLLMDNVLFLQESLVSFIDEQLKACPGPKTNAMLLDWMRWKTSPGETECPLIPWLRIQFPSAEPDSGWQAACKGYLIRRCEAFFVNPNAAPLDAYVSQIANSPIPSSQSTILVLIDEMLRMEHLQINPNSSLAPLITLRNQGLMQFKDAIDRAGGHLERYARQIQDLFSVLAAVSSLYRYRDLTLFLGQEEAEFNQVRQNLLGFLTDYLTNYSLDKEMTSDEVQAFENLNLQYRNKERAFLKQSHEDFVSNFFNIAQQDFHAAWARLEALKPEGAAVHPLTLTNEALTQWLAQSGSLAADGEGVLDVTPYAANRLLLHGLMQPVATWSSLYCHYLTLLIDWLARPSLEDDLSLRAFKQSYPSNWLVNLEFLAIIQSSGLNQEFKQQVISRSFQGSLFSLMSGLNFFVDTMQDHLLTAEQHAAILDTLVGHLGTLIQNGDELRQLFSVSLEELTPVQRMQILSSIEDKLGTLIENGSQLARLCSLPLEKLTSTQRTQILSLLANKLGSLIQNGPGLAQLFSLPIEKLTSEQRTLILSSVGSQLGAVIGNGGELKRLFFLSFEALTAAQRTQILSFVGPQLGTLIKDGWDLSGLFSLSIEKLTSEQRTLILSSLGPELGGLIRHGKCFLQLFSLALDALTAEQRVQIFSSIVGRLGTLIKDGEELMLLFSLPIEKLTSDQRTEIFSSVVGRLGTLIKDGEQLVRLFSLPLEKLTPEQRIEICSSVSGRLGALIENRGQLQRLFSLPLEKLTSEQRTKILSSLAERLGTLFENGEQLRDFFLLSTLNNLTSEQCTQILSSLAGQLGTLIQNSDELRRLFLLRLDRLTLEQRTQILSSIEGQLGALIQRSDELMDLFSVPIEGLTLEQRSQILNALGPERLRGLFEDGHQLQTLFELPPEQLTVTQRREILNAIGLKQLELLVPDADKRRHLLASLTPPSADPGNPLGFFSKGISNFLSKVGFTPKGP